MNLGEIPARVTHGEFAQVPIAAGYLEALRADHDRAVAQALCASFGSGEGRAKRGAVGRRPQHLRARQEAGQRRLADLGVDRAVVLVLAPRLRRFIEGGEGEIGDTLEHRHQSTFELAPERFDLPVLIR